MRRSESVGTDHVRCGSTAVQREGAGDCEARRHSSSRQRPTTWEVVGRTNERGVATVIACAHSSNIIDFDRYAVHRGTMSRWKQMMRVHHPQDSVRWPIEPSVSVEVAHSWLSAFVTPCSTA
jgi:hypothetical protein